MAPRQKMKGAFTVKIITLFPEAFPGVLGGPCGFWVPWSGGGRGGASGFSAPSTDMGSAYATEQREEVTKWP